MPPPNDLDEVLPQLLARGWTCLLGQHSLYSRQCEVPGCMHGVSDGGKAFVDSMACPSRAAYPTSGGLYFWSSRLAGVHSPLASWVTGWFNLLGQVAITAGIEYSLVRPAQSSESSGASGGCLSRS